MKIPTIKVPTNVLPLDSATACEDIQKRDCLKNNVGAHQRNKLKISKAWAEGGNKAQIINEEYGDLVKAHKRLESNNVVYSWPKRKK